MEEQIPQWFAWKIKPGKFEKTKQYLETNVPEITSILYPFQNNLVGKRKRISGLYDLYIFLKYVNTGEVWHKIHSIPIGIQYIGSCAEEDIACITKVISNKI